ncbi:hypothetical protein ACK3Y2_17095 [Aeromonas caviae]
MNMTQKVLTKIFESLLNTAAQAPKDDIVNRDGISLMKQGFELIMQAHREGGATGPTSPLLADASQLLADIEAARVAGTPPISLASISEQLARIEATLAPIHDVVVTQDVRLDLPPESLKALTQALEREKHNGGLVQRLHIR